MRLNFSEPGRVLRISDAGAPPGVVTEILKWQCALSGDDPGLIVFSSGGVPSHLVAFVPARLWREVEKIVRRHSRRGAVKMGRGR